MDFSKKVFIFSITFLLPLSLPANEGHSPMGNMQGMKGGMGGSHGPHWLAPDEYQKNNSPVAADHESVERGESTFNQYCAACHGASGKGDGPAGAALNPKPANLAMMAGMHPQGDIAWKIRHGRGAMPAWGAVLKANQVWDVVNYLKEKIAKGGMKMKGHHMHEGQDKDHKTDNKMKHKMERGHANEHDHE